MGWTFYNSSGQQLRNTGTVLATQTEMEAGSVLTSFVTPGRTQYHPGVAKAWASITSAGALSTPDYGIASVDDDGTGDHDINFTTAFSSIIFSCLATVAGEGRYIHIDLPSSASEVQMNTKLTSDGSTVSDTARYVAFFGVQV